MNKKIIPRFIANTANDTAYMLYKVSERFLRPPFDKYNFQTFEVFKKVLVRDSNCIDIGAHKGEILMKMLNAAPNGRHFAFEPIPYLHRQLKRRFGNTINLYECALSDTDGEDSFVWYKNRPAVSGFKDRVFDDNTYEKAVINVKKRRLDDCILKHEREWGQTKISLIKIDVEGAEMQVLRGSAQIIKRDKPFVLFEYGYVGSHSYGVPPEEMFDFFANNGMKVSLLEYFLKNLLPLDKQDFCNHYYKGYNHFFIAYNEAKSYTKK